jgi:succinate dehydrogenase assembly factor 2
MQNLIKASLRVVISPSLVKTAGSSPSSVILLRGRLLSSKNSSSDGDDSSTVQIIESNEADYFGKVKKSFDDLKKVRETESLEEKRSRLLYQSRKRGTLENGLLLSNFSAVYLPKMTDSQLNEYDKIINGLHNEWDLYYWLTNAVPVPDEFSSSEILGIMKKYCLNEQNQSRVVQPDIK